MPTLVCYSSPMNRSGNTIAKVVIILAAVLLVVFGVAKRVAAPVEEGLLPEAAEETMEEGGVQLEGGESTSPKTVQELPPPPVPPEPSCGAKNSVCESSDDCCGNLGLECQDVRTSDGGRSKRCLPVEVRICRSDCENGTWQSQRSCRDGVAPSDMQRCETFVGSECKTSANEHRNTKECWDT